MIDEDILAKTESESIFHSYLREAGIDFNHPHNSNQLTDHQSKSTLYIIKLLIIR